MIEFLLLWALGFLLTVGLEVIGRPEFFERPRGVALCALAWPLVILIEAIWGLVVLVQWVQDR